MSLKTHIYDSLWDLGIGRQSYRIYDMFGPGVNSNFEPEVDSTLLDGWNDEFQGKVVLPLTHSRMDVNTAIVCILAHGYLARGYEPVIPVCDAGLPCCLIRNTAKNNVSERTCYECTYSGRKAFQKFGLEEFVTRISPEQPPEIETNMEYYKGFYIGRYALSTTRRILRRYTLDLESEPDRTVYRQTLKSSAILVDAYAEILDGDVKALLTPSPTYFNGGIPLAMAVSEEVPAYSYGVGYQDQTLVFARMGSTIDIQFAPEKEALEHRLQTKLSTTERKEIDRIMDGRKTGEGVRLQHSPSMEGTEKNASETKVGVFTNLLWDASLAGTGGPYQDVFEWLFDTLDKLSELDAEIILKTHPAEAIMGTNESVYDRVNEAYDELPENLSILTPETDVSPYDLYEELDAGVVFNSTVGLEMSYQGIAVVTGGNPHYRDLGITHDPGSKGAYVYTLGRILDLEMDADRQAKAIRYAYHLFVDRHISFPFYRTDDDGRYRPLPVVDSEVRSEGSPLETIVQRTIQGDPVIPGEYQ